MHTGVPYGTGDSSFQAAGDEPGITVLVNAFYDIMSSNTAFQDIRSLHPKDDSRSRDKLARFLCGWLGGPRRCNEKYGPINIPAAHAHLKVTQKLRDQWLNCMAMALEQQDYPSEFVSYLSAQLAVPAERIRMICEQQSTQQPVEKRQ